MKDERQELQQRLMGPEEAARVTGLHRYTVTRLCRQGVIPAVKLGNSWLINREKFMAQVGLA